MRATISPEPAVLGFLLNGSMHGYDLYKQAHDRLGMVWHVGQSQLYAIINVYAERGWIRTRVQAQGNRPARKILELTAAGTKAFEQWLVQPARGLREFRVDFFMRLYFASATGALSARQLVDQQIAASQKDLETLRARDSAVAADDDFNRLTRSFRIQQLSTILKWLETNRDELIRLAKSAAVADSHKLQFARRTRVRRKK
jgi:DNA-binding PadR family transcriptional regulator